MALDTAYRPLAGVQPLRMQPADLSAERQRISDAEVRAHEGAQGLLSTYERGLELKQKVEADRIRANLKKQLPANATPLDLQLLERHGAEIGGELPKTFDERGRQVIDVGALRNLFDLKTMAEIQTKSQTGALTDDQKVLLKEFADRGVLSEAYSGGQLRSGPELAAHLATLGPAMTKEYREQQQAALDMQKRWEDLQEVRKIIDEDGEEVVGPWVGSKPARWWSRFRAMMGDEPHTRRVESQRQAEMFITRDVLGLIEKMKGSLSEKELDQLLSGVPKIQDTGRVWTEYLDKMSTALQASAENLRTGTTHQVTPEFWDQVRQLQGQASQAAAQEAASPAFNPNTAARSQADKVPQVVQGYKNSVLIAGTPSTNVRTGKRGVVLSTPGDQYGRFIELDDSILTWIRAAQNATMNNQPPPRYAPPAPAPAPRSTPRRTTPNPAAAPAPGMTRGTSGIRG